MCTPPTITYIFKTRLLERVHLGRDGVILIYQRIIEDEKGQRWQIVERLHQEQWAAQSWKRV